MPTLAHLSDVHFGAIDDRVAGALVAELRERGPDYVVVSGDLTQRARGEQFALARAFLDKLPRPLLVVPGNHDVPLWDVIRRFTRPLSRYRKLISGDLNPTLGDARVCILGLNSTRPLSWRLHGFWKDGAVSDRQLGDFALRASRAQPGAIRIAVAHHPFIAPGGSDDNLGDVIRNAPAALATFATCGVELILGGHLHRAYHGDACAVHKVNGRIIYSIQAASATSTRLRGEANSYNWITIDDHQVAVAVRAWSTTTDIPAGGGFTDGQTTVLPRV